MWTMLARSGTCPCCFHLFHLGPAEPMKISVKPEGSAVIRNQRSILGSAQQRSDVVWAAEALPFDSIEPMRTRGFALATPRLAGRSGRIAYGRCGRFAEAERLFSLTI